MPKPENLLGAAALFTSLSTLVCCALPAMLVALGAGAAVAGLIGAVPQIVLLSEYKGVVFGVAGVILVAAAATHYAGRNAPCPPDPAQAQACRSLRRMSAFVLMGAGAVYAVGFFFAFLAAGVLA